MPNTRMDRQHRGNSQCKTISGKGPLKGKNGVSYKASSNLSKPNHRKIVADRVGNHSLVWDQNSGLPKTPPFTNSIFSFGAGSFENDIPRPPLGKTSERENYPCGEINYSRNSKGPDGDHGVVQRRGDRGVEEYLPFNRG